MNGLESGTLRAIGKRGGYAGIALFVALLFLRTPLEALLNNLSQLPAHVVHSLVLAILLIAFAISTMSFVVYLVVPRVDSSTIPFPNLALACLMILSVGGVSFYLVDKIIPAIHAQEVPKPPAPPAQTPATPAPANPPAPRDVIRLAVCTGEHASKCPPGYTHLGCGADLNGWAQSRCENFNLVGLGSVAGNKCGYGFYEVVCTGPIR